MIKIVNLQKKIKQTEVLTNINYSFEPGKIYGVFGKNGSGKTMLL
ncbi:ATP-binding cassette domain-containing protein, partial [Listeria monocytogenes]|nr:ATP-binding cassette domain-containing protein [Listeria monocytogenes]